MDAQVKKKKMNKGLKIFLIILIVLFSLIILAAGTVFTFWLIGKNQYHPATVDPASLIDNFKDYGSDVSVNDDGTTINYKGKTYVQNKDVIYVTFLGVDKHSLDTVEGVERSAGQSDTNMIVAIDTKKGKMSLVVIPRDTMAEVNVLRSDGESVGFSEMQLCLAYAFGDGRETSCLNVLTSMEKLLFGIELDNYYSLDLDGIGSLNDAVGGIEVTSLETIKSLGRAGDRIALWGQNARTYVQYRDITNPDSDSLRRQRQIQYMKAFVSKAFSAVKAEFPGKVTELYNIAGNYGCTNFDISHVTYLAQVLVSKYSVFNINDEDIYVLKGEGTRPDGGFLEVRLDRENVLETILKVFYNEVK